MNRGQALSVASTTKFVVGMAVDPLDHMRKIGLAAPTAVMMNRGFSTPEVRKFLYVTGGENVRPILSDPTTFMSANVPPSTTGTGPASRLRRGLIGAQGAEHLHYRTQFVKLTGRAFLADFAFDVARHIDEVMGKLPKDEPVDLIATINDIVRYYAVVTMFKDDNPEVALEIGREITRWIELGYSAGNLLLPVNVRGFPHARYRQSAEQIERKILAWAAERRGMDARRDILSMFVNGPDENGNPLPEERLTGHILTIYAASFSSSVAALIWSLYLLMQNPDIANDLCDELDGSGIDPLSNGVELLDLPLLDRVLAESMRLFTPVPYQVRRVRDEARSVPLDLRPKDIAIVGSWATNRLASFYEDAERFKPDRWLTMSTSGYDYLTFSAGPRRCVGYSLAMIMVKITLASILMKRRPTLVPDTQIDMRVAVTLRTRRPVPTLMQDRDARFVRAPVRGTVTRMVAQ